MPPKNSLPVEDVEEMGVPAFSQPEERNDPIDLDATEMETETDPSLSESSERGSSPTSTKSLIGRSAQVKAFSSLISVALRAFGGVLNARLAQNEDDTTWLMDADDEDAIAPPLARIVTRHSPLGPDGPTSDLADAIEAVVGGLGYVLMNLQKRRQERAAQNPPFAPPDEPAQPSTPLAGHWPNQS